MSLEHNRAQSESTGSSRKFSVLTSVRKYLLMRGIIIFITIVFLCFLASRYRRKAVSSVNNSAESIKYQHWSSSSEKQTYGE
jgi:cbb3-type cytochrome oxidase subunit 3